MLRSVAPVVGPRHGHCHRLARFDYDVDVPAIRGRPIGSPAISFPRHQAQRLQVAGLQSKALSCANAVTIDIQAIAIALNTRVFPMEQQSRTVFVTSLRNRLTCHYGRNEVGGIPVLSSAIRLQSASGSLSS